jgi:hypothetical protein
VTIDAIDASEDHEIAAWRDLAAAAAGHGVDAGERDGAFLIAAPACPVPAFNRVLGIGRRGAPTVEEIRAAAAWYADRGIDRYWLQLGRRPIPPAVERWLSEHRFVLEYRSVLLVRSVRGPLVGPVSNVEIRRASVDDGPSVGRVAATCFGWPPSAKELSASVVGREGWRHYLVYDGPAPVGCGATYESAGTAWLGFAGVLESHRERGGQTALIARRLEDAARECHTAIVDVAEGSSSHRNCVRAGFAEVGVRPIYGVAPRRGMLTRLLHR